jgi:uncharacterized membrane protein
MIPFFSAFAVFLVLHSIPAVPSVRSGIIARVGRPTYFLAYSAASVLALAWLFSSALSLDYVPLWDLKPWHAVVTFVLAPFGGFLVLAGLASSNPLSVAIKSSDQPGAVVRICRHPVLWGFAFWALGHIAANGDLRSVLLFGGLAIFSLSAIPMIERRAKRRLGDRWQTLSAKTSMLPLGALLKGQPLAMDMPMVISAAVAAGLSVWLLFGGGHALLFGADPIAIFG